MSTDDFLSNLHIQCDLHAAFTIVVVNSLKVLLFRKLPSKSSRLLFSPSRNDFAV